MIKNQMEELQELKESLQVTDDAVFALIMEKRLEELEEKEEPTQIHDPS